MAWLRVCLAAMFAVTTAAISFPANSTSASNQTLSSGTITRAPTAFASSTIANASCSTCVIAVDLDGLKQVFWYTSTWSVTLDTEFVTVTTFNGSNATGVSNTRTVLGDLSTVNTANASYVSVLLLLNYEDNGYFDTSATLVRGTDGSVGTTSFSYGQAFAEVTAVQYRYLTPDLSNGECPSNMGKLWGTACSCVMNTWFPPFLGEQIPCSSTSYNLDATYYQPLSFSVINMGNAAEQDPDFPIEPWDGEAFSAWLDGNEAMNSQLPNWRECAYWNTANGPPGVKVPVKALTATVVTTVPGSAYSSSPGPPTSIAPSIAMAHSTAQPDPSPSDSASEGSLGGSKSGGSGDSGPSGDSSSGGSGTSGSQSSQVSDSTGGSGNNDIGSGNQGIESTEDSGSSDSGSSSSGFGSNSNSDLTSSSNHGSVDGFPGSENSPPASPFVVSAEGYTISGTVHGSTAVVIAGTTITAGSAPSSADGFLISVAPGASSIAVNGESQPLPTAGSALGAAALPIAIASVGGQAITASPGASGVYYAGTALSQNGPHPTIGGTDVYVGPSGLVVGGSSTVAIPSAPNPGSSNDNEPKAVTFTAAGQTFTSFPSGILVASTTIQSGSTAVISGTTISYGPSGLAIGTSIIPIPTPPPTTGPGSGPTHIFTLGGETFTANPTAIGIDGTTLTANGPAVSVSGTLISLNLPAGLVIASSTYAIPPSALPSSTTVINGQTFTINPTAIAISGTLLTEGGSAITIHGTRISLGPAGLVIAGSTVPYLNSPLTDASQTSEGLGAVILAGFGPSRTTASATGSSRTTSPTAFEGAAAEKKSISSREHGLVFVALIVGHLVGFSW